MILLRIALPALALVTATACGPAVPPRPHVHADAERGYRLEVPAGWLTVSGEYKSPAKTLLSLQLHSLDGADRNFVARLPESLVPQLEEWARYYFGEVGEPERSAATVGGIEALEMIYPVTVRAGEKPGRVLYWVVRRGDLLYTFRAVVPAQAPPADEADLRRMIASIAFTEPPPVP